FAEVRGRLTRHASHEIWGRATSVGKSETDFRISSCRSADQQALYRACGIGSIFDGGIADSRDDAATAQIIFGMRVDDRLTPVEFFIDRRKKGIAEIFV